MNTITDSLRLYFEKENVHRNYVITIVLQFAKTNIMVRDAIKRVTAILINPKIKFVILKQDNVNVNQALNHAIVQKVRIFHKMYIVGASYSKYQLFFIFYNFNYRIKLKKANSIKRYEKHWISNSRTRHHIVKMVLTKTMVSMWRRDSGNQCCRTSILIQYSS